MATKAVWGAVAAAIFATAALGHGEPPAHTKPRPLDREERAFGREGDARNATRTIDIELRDSMRFSRDRLQIRQGETVRFRLTNGGKLMHEMVIGTLEELRAHAELMRKHPGMEHEAPYMAHVAPGRTGTLVWQFTRVGEFYYGCLVPGHFEAGMRGSIIVTKGSNP